MRLSTVFGVLVLFAAPLAFAQAPQPTWLGESRAGCRVWTPFREPDGSVSASGTCQNGVTQGQTVLRLPPNGTFDEHDDGESRDGKFSGRGAYTFANGDRYEGEFRDDRFNGWGIYTFANGDRYDGEFHDDKRNGRGVYVSANGDRYDGEFRDDKRNGRGVSTSANGDRYDGQFRDGKRNGRGVYTNANGDRYDGEFRDDKFSGRGIYTFAHGDRYDGEFRDGIRNGRGIYTNANGERYDGEFRDDKLIGKPIFHPKHNSEIPLIKEEGILVVPVTINNALTLKFMVDSGAGDVSVPADVVTTLMRLGSVKASDFLGKKLYRLADGSTVPSSTFRIRVLKVGDREIENVTASIASVEGGLLLGQSFLNRFKSWSIDNQRQVLVLN